MERDDLKIKPTLRRETNLSVIKLLLPAAMAETGRAIGLASYEMQ